MARPRAARPTVVGVGRRQRHSRPGHQPVRAGRRLAVTGGARLVRERTSERTPPGNDGPSRVRVRASGCCRTSEPHRRHDQQPGSRNHHLRQRSLGGILILARAPPTTSFRATSSARTWRAPPRFPMGSTQSRSPVRRTTKSEALRPVRATCFPVTRGPASRSSSREPPTPASKATVSAPTRLARQRYRNLLDGIGTAQDVPNTIIGGTAAGAGNLVSGNGGNWRRVLTHQTMARGNLSGPTSRGPSLCPKRQPWCPVELYRQQHHRRNSARGRQRKPLQRRSRHQHPKHQPSLHGQPHPR